MSLTRTLVLNVVGLTPALLQHAPNLNRLAREGGMRPLTTVTPAVTTTVQSTFVTGALPRDHGIVANGWYFRDLSEVLLWRQSNRLVQGEKLWDAAQRRDPAFTCAKLFWWYNMYSIGRHRGDAAADVPGRRPQAAGHLHQPARAARRAAAAARAVPAVPLLGAGRGHRLQPLDRALRAGRIRAVSGPR